MVCSFVDFKSAFDTVWRLGLCQKLQKSNIQGKIFEGGAGTTYPSGAPEFTPGFLIGFVLLDLMFSV
jgi:hypothetical protein